MLCTASALMGYTSSARTLRPALLSRPQCTMDEASAVMLKSLNDVFWKNKKALVEAELNQKMRELEEYQAREAALYESLMVPALSSGAATPALTSAGSEVAALQAELTAEKQRTAALEAELEAVRLQSEVDLQKVAAFWCVRTPSGEPWLCRLHDCCPAYGRVAKQRTSPAPADDAAAAASAPGPAAADVTTASAPLLEVRRALV